MTLEMVFPLKCIIIMSKRYLLEMTAGLIKLDVRPFLRKMATSLCLETLRLTQSVIMFACPVYECLNPVRHGELHCVCIFWIDFSAVSCAAHPCQCMWLEFQWKATSLLHKKENCQWKYHLPCKYHQTLLDKLNKYYYHFFCSTHFRFVHAMSPIFTWFVIV